MILSDEEIQERIESPLNLLNRLKSITSKAPNGSLALEITKLTKKPPTSAEIIDNLEDKIAEAFARTKATTIMNKAMNELETRIPDIQKPMELATIATNMSKIIANQSQAQTNRSSTSQIIVYAPQVQSLDNFDVIEVKE